MFWDGFRTCEYGEHKFMSHSLDLIQGLVKLSVVFLLQLMMKAN